MKLGDGETRVSPPPSSLVRSAPARRGRAHSGARHRDAETVDGVVASFILRSSGSASPITEYDAVPSSDQVLSTASCSLSATSAPPSDPLASTVALPPPLGRRNSSRV